MRVFVSLRYGRCVGAAANEEFMVRCCKSQVQLLEFRKVEGELMASQNRVFPGKPPSAEGNLSEIAQEAIREELSRILESSIFIQSDRLGRFLRYTVETTLAGEAETLKEYSIGTDVYERKPPYHPSVDSIVRSEARRLRSKLKEYYESEGKNDSVFIYYRPGSYVPAFRSRDKHECGCLATDRALREILTGRLVAKALEVPSASREINLQIVFEGTVRILRSRAESPGPVESRPGRSVAKRIQLRKVVGMSSTNADHD
jgi:hypothetical protein